MIRIAKRGQKFVFHGAFKSKKNAIKKEGKANGRFIVERSIKGKKRYVVLSPK